MKQKSDQFKDIDKLYYGHTCSCSKHIELSDGDTLFDTEKIINDALLNIYADTNIINGVEPNLWKLTFDKLNKAVDKGFGTVKYESPDFHFVNQLKRNNGVFAAFAAYNQKNELAKHLFDKEGKLKPFYKFKKDTKHIVAKHDRHRLTEYNTAVSRARSAADFKKFQKTAHLYPNITWLPSRSPNPDAIHKGFYGTTLPINHPFWLSNYPGCRWECKCGWERSDEELTQEPENIETQAGLDVSPIKSLSIFSSSHPHVQRVSKLKRPKIKKAADKLLRQASQADCRVWAKENIDPVKGLVIESNNIEGGKLTIRRKDIKNLSGKAHKHFYQRNLIVKELPNIFDDLEYVGYSLEIENHVADEWFYYRVEINGEDSYLCVMKVDNEYRPHAITDKNVLDKIQKKP